jgi:imidazolonepropionase-like amidohydrolase
MIRRWRLVLFLGFELGLCMGARAQSGATAEKTTYLKCGRLLDVRTGELKSDQLIGVTGSRITSVASAATVRLAADAKVIDLSKSTCLPGLIDVHTHLVGRTGDEYSGGPLRRSAAEMAFDSIANARATLEAGFTTVRDLGTYRAFVDVALRDAIHAGTIPGPRMQVAGAYVTISGGAGALTNLAPDIQLPHEMRYGIADGPDQVRQRVRDIVRHGADVIKVLATGAILTPRSRPSQQEFTEEELRAAVEEAAKAGLKVAAHAHSAAGAQAAVRAGVASIEHGSLLDDETLRLMKERGVFLSLDVIASWDFWPGGKPENKPAGYPQESVDKEIISYESQQRVARRALALGVKIAFATDAGVIPHGRNAILFTNYVRLGFPPLAAIQAATVNAAELLGWAERVGTIEPGKLADIIAVPGNPLEDIALMHRVVFVLKDGHVYKGPRP